MDFSRERRMKIEGGRERERGDGGRGRERGCL